MYVSIEGIDTAGKSTQLDILRNKFPDAIFTKEPGGTALGIKLRQMILNGEANSNIAEMFLFLADRAEHTKEIIIPNLDKLIISDRSFISGIAYALEENIEKLIELNKLATQNNFPNKIILLELSKDELINRLSKKKNDSIEQRGIDYLLSIQSRMKEVIKNININHIIIDASEKIEVIEKQIEDFVDAK
ncbi:dTMP kinase [Aliarcobacter vitoriensis]|uniref:Thymidylate kinase n=1 Tax=Aliarcobacter vitoriensis TaxID=2011099 RepID=A0A366MRQ3_9BACT|nr:dTMP kinase [Aliarcobacter vitoriensis]RBQ28290.1 dTMP kinase [Aliarcobacter vitoriensis]